MITSFFSASLLGFAAAIPSLSEPLLFSRAACSGNTANTRSEWCDFSVDTDYTSIAPDTGVTRECESTGQCLVTSRFPCLGKVIADYMISVDWFDITETTASPDGVERYVQAINGSIPGPTIIADWGK